MKIQIDSKDLNFLNKQIEQQEREIEDLEKEIKNLKSQLSESDLIEKAQILSYRLFDNYMSCVFKELGFDNWNEGVVRMDSNIKSYYSDEWWQNDNFVNVNVSANVAEEFANAFLNIRIAPKSAKKDKLTLK